MIYIRKGTSAAPTAARSEAEAAAAEARTAEASQKAAEASEKAAAANAAAKEAEERTAVENRKAAEASAAEAKSRADEARSRAAEAKAAAAAARDAKDAEAAKAEAEEAKAKTAADKLAADKVKAEKILAEAKLLELRRIDFETIERELAEWRRDLEERERALTPEKTIADLAWAGGQEDSVLDENGNVTKKTKEPYLVENDRSLPRASRSLAKAEREMREELAAQTEATRDSLVASLEKLYIAAVKEDRVTDADFYRRSIRSLSPTWRLGVDAVKSEEGGQAEGKQETETGKDG